MHVVSEKKPLNTGEAAVLYARHLVIRRFRAFDLLADRQALWVRCAIRAPGSGFHREGVGPSNCGNSGLTRSIHAQSIGRVSRGSILS